MLETKTKEKLADAARTLAASYELVVHKEVLYLPVDYETRISEPLPPPERKVWIPLDRHTVQQFGNRKAHILFANESELVNFEGMLKQLACTEAGTPQGVFTSTSNGLKLLDEQGNLRDPSGRFYPNHLVTPLNEDPDDKAFVLSVITEWLGGEMEEVTSLLHHFATALAPSWSAVKYVLLLGEGRNGKSVLLQMMLDLLGRENVSNVSRQQMSEQSPVVTELNGKLANIVMDGSMEYLKDSGMEKTLIAGETGAIRPLYVSRLIPVQTNGLFIEALNQEPKTRDKSSALQKRIVRFRFPNVYALDTGFSRKMRSPKMLGAFLSLLTEHYVKQELASDLLAPTKGAVELQLDQMVLNSVFHQFLMHLINNDPTAADRLVGKDVNGVISAFIPWVQSNHNELYSETEALNLFKRNAFLKRSSRRDKTPKNFWKLTGWKSETELLINQLKGE